MKRITPLILALALSVSVAACGGGGSDTPAKPGQVLVQDNVFKPKSIDVKVGDTVTWKFAGNSAHNVTFDDFNSELMKDGTFEHTFDKAGSFEYRCTGHTGMTAKVIVS